MDCHYPSDRLEMVLHLYYLSLSAMSVFSSLSSATNNSVDCNISAHFLCFDDWASFREGDQT